MGGRRGGAELMAETPPCRVCGLSIWVCIHREDAPEKAICIACCETAKHDDGETGHVWEYERAERDHTCQHCGELRRNAPYDHSEYDET
jgi:hypothetical protein